ncbi:PIN domain-containing protein [Nocardia stercoris]|uniref:PIN domain-containing protein n=1 Tax=Nocardia stercoris TaxID=2483361 RepID=A0A3M2KWH5_9NOCA|nr:PIN domain-containing protein [Nocardia stercoris]RMI29922.1 PIN domain-containing protein [Nocardia stercoris]
MFAALLDTCVLWQSLQRDFLLSLATQGLYRPLWSNRILDELEFHEEAKLTRRGMNQTAAAARSRRLVSAMRTAFDDAIVLDWEPLEGTFQLPDPDDEHVVAAALIGGADTVVTSNLKDFPHDCLPAHMTVSTPGHFAANTVAVSPSIACQAFTTMLTRYHRPAVSVAEAFDILAERYSMIEAVELMRSAR